MSTTTCISRPNYRFLPSSPDSGKTRKLSWSEWRCEF